MTVYDDMNRLRKEVEEKAALLKAMESEHFDVNGIWEFSTEGDCEGRSTKHLGTYQGNIFDGIKKYGNQSYYRLACKKVGSYKPSKESISKKVHFTVYDQAVKLNDPEDAISKLKSSVPAGHSLTGSNYYGCIALEWKE
ncbi:hypothetical protein L8C07_05775 [Paenibacillus sp. CMAA1739]|uniref:hypothetical protein n=1 Tax=Paenibacillus ottowii TaxID=2315729 RepID=UPI002DB5B05E|nr:hypothetical protein [Paenibacillus sp. CMAA1739]MEC4565447.1 hypothetical protein [Paenibacillus sp. CMAA1739]